MVQENKRILYHTFGQKLAYMPTSLVDIRIGYFDAFSKKKREEHVLKIHGKELE